MTTTPYTTPADESRAKRAFEFYESSPDGQYDTLAAKSIREAYALIEVHYILKGVPEGIELYLRDLPAWCADHPEAVIHRITI